MEMVLVMFVGWVVIVCMALLLAGIIKQDEKSFKAGCLGMLLIISGGVAGLVIAYTVNVVTSQL